MSVVAIRTIMELAFQAIPLVERIIKGPGRGEEKKNSAIDYIFEELDTALEHARRANYPNLKDYEWVELLKNTPEISEKLSAVIDSVVDLMNALGEFERKPTLVTPITSAQGERYFQP